jgi:hypothetical protein
MPMSHSLLSDQIRAFLESGVAVVVGTRDAKLLPETTRGWGPIAEANGIIGVCIPLPAGQKTLENLSDNGKIALALGSPINYEQLQVKGHCVEIIEANESDVARVGRHREEFARACEGIGTLRSTTEQLFLREVDNPPVLVKIRFQPEQIFDQTPGPNAGVRL